LGGFQTSSVTDITEAFGYRQGMGLTGTVRTKWVTFHFCLFLAAAVLPGGRPLCAEDPKALVEKGEILCGQGKLPAALKLYEATLQADPSMTVAYRGIVHCYRAMDDPEGAVRFMESLYLEHPEQAEVFYGLGYAHYEAGNYDAARRHFEKAVSLNVDLAEAWNNCAVIDHFITRDYEKARTSYEKAIEVGRRTGNRYVLAIAEKNLANLPSPVKLKAVEEKLTVEEFLGHFISGVDRGDATGIRELAMGQRRNCQEAMDWLLGEACRLHGAGRLQDEEARLLIARVLAEVHEKAFKDPLLVNRLEAYGRLSPEDKRTRAEGLALLHKGSEHETAGRFDEARRQYQEALLRFEKIGDRGGIGISQVSIGDASLKSGEYLRAQEAYEKGLSIFVASGEAYRQAVVLSSLGVTYLRLGDRRGAMSFLKQSCEIYDRLGEKDLASRLRADIRTLEEREGR
jgi:tetratricopeptide (TPR) repeat protein